jgi:hypothetical protein
MIDGIGSTAPKRYGKLFDLRCAKPENYSVEALAPIANFWKYRVFYNTVVRDFYTLPRSTIMGSRLRVCSRNSSTTSPFAIIIERMPAVDRKHWSAESFTEQKWWESLNVTVAEPLVWSASNPRIRSRQSLKRRWPRRRSLAVAAAGKIKRRK